jgi:hypothetical protein
MLSLDCKGTILSTMPVGAGIKVARFSRGIDVCPGVCIQYGVLLPACLQAILLTLNFSYIPITFKCIHLDQKRNFHAFHLVKK